MAIKNYTAPCIGPYMLLHYLCEILTSAKQAINDKLQGSVATYLMFDGAANNQIKKGLLRSL